MGLQDWLKRSDPAPASAVSPDPAADLCMTTRSTLRSWDEVRPSPAVEPPPSDPLQAAIDAVENQLNRKRGEIDELCQQIRPDALQREMSTLRAAQRVAIKNFLDDWMPVVREMREEYARLDEQRRSLLAERDAAVRARA